jgi:hypothetical protein
MVMVVATRFFVAHKNLLNKGHEGSKGLDTPKEHRLNPIIPYKSFSFHSPYYFHPSYYSHPSLLCGGIFSLISSFALQTVPAYHAMRGTVTLRPAAGKKQMSLNKRRAGQLSSSEISEGHQIGQERQTCALPL